jgi:hypothetical protein
MTLNQKTDKVLREIRYMKRTLKELRDSNSFMAHEARFVRRPTSEIFRNKKALSLSISLLDKGHTYESIANELNRRIKNFKTTKSSVGRFRTLYIRSLHNK